MDFRILGQTEVLDGARRLELPGGRGRALLGLLIIHAGEPVAADRIVDELWGEDPPRTAVTVVQGLVSRLRRTLEPGRTTGMPWHLLETSAKGYRLASRSASMPTASSGFSTENSELEGSPPPQFQMLTNQDVDPRLYIWFSLGVRRRLGKKEQAEQTRVRILDAAITCSGALLRCARRSSGASCSLRPTEMPRRAASA